MKKGWKRDEKGMKNISSRKLQKGWKRDEKGIFSFLLKHNIYFPGGKKIKIQIFYLICILKTNDSGPLPFPKMNHTYNEWRNMLFWNKTPEKCSKYEPKLSESNGIKSVVRVVVPAISILSLLLYSPHRHTVETRQWTTGSYPTVTVYWVQRTFE